jgi:hypothetical protein
VVSRLSLAAALLLACAALAAPPAVREIGPPGGSGSVRTGGAVERGGRDVYAFDARRGQWAELRVSARESNAALVVWQPGAVLPATPQEEVAGQALPGTEEGRDATRWKGRLPASGRYLVVVGPTRGNASYTLQLSLGRPPAAAAAAASAPPK